MWRTERNVAVTTKDTCSFIFISLALSIIKAETTSKSQCVGWSQQSGDDNSCVCGNDINKLIRCDNYTLKFSVIDCIAITYSSTSQKMLAGRTPFTCKNFLLDKGTPKYAANTSANNFTEIFCNPNNRQGFLCSECMPGYGVPIYSYDLRCVSCSERKVEWLKYIAMAYLPVTVFYVILALFRISTTSGRLNVLIMVSQILSSPQILRQVINSDFELSNRNLNGFIASLLTFFSMWNLDFFRFFYTPFCINPTLTTLDVILLDYLVAMYPLLLILLTYILVKLHDRYPCVVWLCTPLRKCTANISSDWNMKNSVIGYFSTFMILSYFKVLYTSIDLLAFTPVYNSTGSAVGLVSYYNGSMTILKSQHIPYGVIAIVMTTIFNVLPFLLLLFFPFSCFQKLLNATKCQSQFLHIFMDSILGCYSHDKYDFRFLAAINVALRLLNVFVLLKLLDRAYCTIMAMVLMLYIIFIAIFKPFKKDSHGYLAISALLALSYTYIVVPYSQGHENHLNLTLYPALICMMCLFIQGVASFIYSVCPKAVSTYLKTHSSMFLNKFRKNGSKQGNYLSNSWEEEDQMLHLLL